MRQKIRFVQLTNLYLKDLRQSVSPVNKNGMKIVTNRRTNGQNRMKIEEEGKRKQKRKRKSPGELAQKVELPLSGLQI